MRIDDLRAALARPARTLDHDGRRAAVALVLDARGNALLIRRAERPGDPWSGQVALPGGHLHADESWRQAAERETREEVGLDLRDADLLGALDEHGTPAIRPSRRVRPLVYVVERLGALRPDPAEVRSTHTVPLERLLRGEGRASFALDWQDRRLILPCVDVEGHRLWGMTLRIVDDLLDRLDAGGTGLARPTYPARGPRLVR